MAQTSGRSVPVAIARDEAAGKIKRIPGKIAYYFDHVLVIPITGSQLTGRCRHLRARVGLQSADELLSQMWIQKGLIALNIDQDPGGREIPGDFCNPVGPARVGGGSERHLGTERKRDLKDPRVVGCHNDPVGTGNLNAALPNMLDQWLAGKKVKRLAWKTG